MRDVARDAIRAALEGIADRVVELPDRLQFYTANGETHAPYFTRAFWQLYCFCTLCGDFVEDGPLKIPKAEIENLDLGLSAMCAAINLCGVRP